MTEYSPQRQAVRYGLNIEAEVTNLQSEIQLRGQTSDVALFGCGITALSDFPQGTRVRVKLIRADLEVVALGRVVYSRSDLGMGIAFTRIEPSDERILAEWIDEHISPSNPPQRRAVSEQY